PGSGPRKGRAAQGPCGAPLRRAGLRAAGRRRLLAAMCEYAAACDARAMHVGSYSAWLTKVKGEGARAKWLSGATRRYFTIDFGSQIFFYSHAEDQRKVSQPVRFKDIRSAQQLPRPAQAAKYAKDHTFGFVVTTVDKVFELYTVSYLDAEHWRGG
ncbi:unnamed protein product, partial [Prorocentrum cordatum]